MKVDSHYYCIGVLAHNVGFSKDDALLIAHASAYVDFEIRKKPIEVGNGDNLFPEDIIIPIVTQKVSLSSFNKNEQMLVYLPFHFIPSKTSLSYNVIDFKTKPFHENDTAQNLFQEVIASFKNDNDKKNSLIKLGIAMHCIADTYSHQRFSGRHNAENKVSNLKVSYDKGETFQDFNCPLAPQIGHAEIVSIADNPVCHWKSKERNLVKNPNDFELAFEVIYNLLTETKKVIKQTYQISDYQEEKDFTEIKELLFDVVFCKNNQKAIEDNTEKIKMWIDHYPALFDNCEFKASLWWKEILELDESNIQDPEYKRGNKYKKHIEDRHLKYFKINKIKNTNWYKFNQVAKEIRKINLKYLCEAKLPECETAKAIKFIISNMLKAKTSQSVYNETNTESAYLYGNIFEHVVETGYITTEMISMDENSFLNPLNNDELKSLVKKLKRNKQVKHWFSTVQIIDDFEKTRGLKDFYKLIQEGNEEQLQLFYDLINLINILEFLKDGECPNAEIYRDLDGFDLENSKYLLEVAKLDDQDDIDLSILEEEDYVLV